jgi:parallel beta-helix repeat protein
VLKGFVVLAVLISAACQAAPQATAAETCDVHIDAPADLQGRLRDAGPSAVVCLSGTFNTPSVQLLSGQTITGGHIVGSIDMHAGDATVRDVEVSGSDVGVRCGPRATIEDAYIHDNSQTGIQCYVNQGDWGVQITGNRILENGSPTFEGYSAAGIKLVAVSYPGHALGQGATITGNTVSDNNGNGIWLDNSSNASLIEGNVVYGNTRNGIRCEKCGGPIVIRDNTSHDNQLDGVSVVNSAVVALAGNHTYGNGQAGIRVDTFAGVATKIYPAVNPESQGWHIRNIEVDDTRLAGDRVVGCDLMNVDCAA